MWPEHKADRQELTGSHPYPTFILTGSTGEIFQIIRPGETGISEIGVKSQGLDVQT